MPAGEGARNLWIVLWGVNREIDKLQERRVFSRKKAQEDAKGRGILNPRFLNEQNPRSTRSKG
jgi:hypothetical protein